MATETNTATHTPGPWRIEKVAGSLEIHAEGFIGTLAQVREQIDVAVRSAAYAERLREMKANAHLIAAAPELLEALRDCVTHRGCSDGDCCPAAREHTAAIARAETAIAKAEGQVS